MRHKFLLAFNEKGKEIARRSIHPSIDIDYYSGFAPSAAYKREYQEFVPETVRLRPNVKCTKRVIAALAHATGVYPEPDGSVFDQKCESKRGQVERYLEMINGGHVFVDRGTIQKAENSYGMKIFEVVA